MFDWNDLKYFLEVSRRGKLIHAAKSLNVDHTTVSRRIAALQEATGAKLFEKTDKGYIPTIAGQKLLKIAQDMENTASRVQEDIADSNLRLSGSVRVGAPDGLGSFFLAQRLPKLINQYPDLEVELVAIPRYLSLSKREADLAITLERPTSGRLYARKLTDYQLQLFSSAEYLANNPAINNKKDLKDHRLIGYIEDLIFAPGLRYADMIGKNLDTSFRSSNLIAQYQAVLANAGICMLPRFMTHGDKRFVPVLTDSIRLVRSFWLLVHEDMHDLSRVNIAADFITTCVRSEQNLFIEDE